MCKWTIIRLSCLKGNLNCFSLEETMKEQKGILGLRIRGYRMYYTQQGLVVGKTITIRPNEY